MLIYLKGNDSLLASRTIKQIKEKYQQKNPDGAELIEIDETTESPNWSDLQAVPLFATSRLVIIRRVGLMAKAIQQKLAEIITAVPASTVVVIWDAKSTDKALDAVLSKEKVIIVETPQGTKLESWIKQRAKELELTLDSSAVRSLASLSGFGMWYIETELRQMATGLTDISSSTVALQPFAFYSYIRSENWEAVKKEIAKKLEAGEPIELVIGSLAAAVRKELHNQDRARAVVNLLMDIDIGLKTGQLDGEGAAALLIAHLPGTVSNRVQWETAWREAVS